MADTAPHAQNGSPPATAGVKRKRPHETKFYAVREGRKAGVYGSWAECLEQVKGHKNALCMISPFQIYLLNLPVLGADNIAFFSSSLPLSYCRRSICRG